LKATSDNKVRANRANARASTGPKTAQGRTRSARNARRHALSVPVYSDKALSEEVEALAREIAGADASAEMQELARRVAEAQIDLRRVRYARHQFLSDTLSNQHYDSDANEADESESSARFSAAQSTRHVDGSPKEVYDLDTARAGQARDDSIGRGEKVAGDGSLRTTCVVAAQVCDPGFRCGTKASRQRARVTVARAISAAWLSSACLEGAGQAAAAPLGCNHIINNWE
jgi:hypothetical protein